ncbi:MAG: sodium:solute symporter [Melioribacteraceae bacterium]|nr:sodium:solute symporter [Melioribacteraceae bacterium]MCF8263950.1 sodium:solute symporter [Melioribacteraceae bacterium]MCF8411802.1 sodium:solute symporter [Melioribacteraceae bacterium]MCF8431320.1 sodium:solute symporter [Melioribacteraceae bacterium]
MSGIFLDYFVIVAYLAIITFIGLFFSGKKESVNDFFLGGRNVKWWAVALSILAAETSTLTFISIPGLAYKTNLNFLQITIGYLIGRIIVAKYLLPLYYKDKLSTAYSFLELRFGNKTKISASVIFMFTRVAADGVRLFATAIPLKYLLGIDYIYAIMIIGSISLIYSSFGGIRGIILIDVVQMIVYILGALIAFNLIVSSEAVNGISNLLHVAAENEKLSIFNFEMATSLSEFFGKPYTLIASLIGGIFLSMASHGTDQFIVQRLLTIKKLKDAQKAIISSGVLVVFQFFLFLMVGIALYVFYGNLDLKPDEIFPMFIVDEISPGLSGFLIAGVLAAAMSSLAGSISALSSSTVYDILPIFRLNIKDEKTVSIIISIFWSIVLVISAMLFIEMPRSVVEIALGIASFTYGGLLGTFLLGILNKKANETQALISFSFGILGMAILISLSLVAWTWFTFIGVGITLSTGYLLTAFAGSKD